MKGLNRAGLGNVLRLGTARAVDAMMCALISGLHWRLRNLACTPEQLDTYLCSCQGVARPLFYAAPAMDGRVQTGNLLQWRSPIKSAFPENDEARARLFISESGWSSPTIIFLHALMSAHDFGYARISRKMNRRGWNAALMHLPYHYSRVPWGYFNGDLALSADLPANAETLRQAVIEVRQLMAYFRARGCRNFGLIGTSYGGWVGALLSFLEPDFRFITLLQPIVDIEHAIWESPASSVIRKTLRARGIPRGASQRHAHLTSPLHGLPLCDIERVLIIGGAVDAITPPSTLKMLVEAWPGAQYVEVSQGHFGYAAMGEALRQIDRFL